MPRKHSILYIRTLCFLLALLPLCTMAQAYRFVPVRSDSVTFLDRDITNFQLFPRLVSPIVDKPQPLYPPRAPLAELERQWRERVLPALNAVGGSGSETEAQGYAAVANFYDAQTLWLLTGEARYVDAMERALTGGLPAAMFSSPDASERLLCAQAVMDASQLVYATDTAGLYVNFYLNTMAHVATPQFNFMLDQLTAMPFGPMVKLRLRVPDGAALPLALHLRLPEWAVDVPEIYVNGHEADYDVERGYAVIRRTWRARDEVYMLFDLSPRLVSDGGNSFLRCGSIVYCPQDSIAADAVAWVEPAGADTLSRHPLYDLCYQAGSDTVCTRLRPYFETPQPLRRHLHTPGLRLKEP